MALAKPVIRAATQRLATYAENFRVVIVNGPRQAGKTTLLRQHYRQAGGEFRSLDDDVLLRTALDDPVAFAAEGDRPLHLDEVQRGGDSLVRAIKLAADSNWDPGQFVLSGSTRFLTIPTLSESLAGRAAIMELWPLSMAERTGHPASIVDALFGEETSLQHGASPWSRAAYLSVICEGGYPEALRIRPAVREGWFDGYLDTVVQRDVREFARISQVSALPALLALIAARSGSVLVQADLAKSLGNLSADTVRAYLSYLEIVFLLGYARAWSTNLTSKISKTPKAYVTDSGLAAHLLGVNAQALAHPGHPALGGLLETFVFAELTKAAAVSDTSVTISHFRDRDGREVDFILQGRDGRVVAIEVKASASPPADSLRHLRWLRDRLGERFHLGVLLYLGEHTVSSGDRLITMPVSGLWGHAELPR